MYLRTTARVNKDGSVVRYLALAHNQRVGAATKANVLLNLGREDRLDPEGLRRLVRSINRYLGDPGAERIRKPCPGELHASAGCARSRPVSRPRGPAGAGPQPHGQAPGRRGGVDGPAPSWASTLPGALHLVDGVLG
jgi:hypothetical protein